MSDLLIIDFGSSTNYGDKMVGQVVRQYIADKLPTTRIRSASSVEDAEVAGWWRLCPDRIDKLLEGVGCCLLLGGSLFFGQALTVRGTWWIDALEERGIPLISWGGIQHTSGCYDLPTAFGRIVASSRRLFYRFEAEAAVFEDITPGQPVEWGSDPIWCRPAISPVPGNVLCTSISAPYAGGVRAPGPISPLLEFVASITPEFNQHVVLHADAGVMGTEELGLRGVEADQDHWIEHQAARAALLVSTRLHPTLYALRCGRRVLAADWSDKVRMLMEQVGAERYCLPAMEASVEDYEAVWHRDMSAAEKQFTAEQVVRCRDRARWTLRQITHEVREAVK